MAWQKLTLGGSHRIRGNPYWRFNVFRVFCGMLFSSLIWLAIFSSVTAWPQSVSAQKPLPSGAGVQIEAKPQKATVGDPIRIEMNITMPDGFHAEMPNLSGQIGDFQILEYYPGPVVPDDGMPQKPAQSNPANAGSLPRHRASIVVAAYKTGLLTIPSIPITLKAGDGNVHALSSAPLNIEIKSVLAGNNQDLKDLKKQAELREPIRWALWLSLALLCVVAAVIAWLLWKKHKRRSSPVQLPPDVDLLDLAEKELQKLLAGERPQDNEAKRFYVALSDILKRILELGYGIQTTERTTSEIMDSFRLDSTLEPDHQEQIESLLLRCDIVKFAKYIPSPAEHDLAAKDSLVILADVKKARTTIKLPPAEGSSHTDKTIQQPPASRGSD